MSGNDRVLIVDDDRDILQATALRLGAAGYEILVAGDGEAGLRSAIENHPSAIVLDVRMPKMDGIDTLTELKARDDTRGIPVIMLSASLVDEATSLDAGARFFLSKPHQDSSLMDALGIAISETRVTCRDTPLCRN